MKVVLFLCLQSQHFYKKIHQDAVNIANIDSNVKNKKWADIGCGVGMMSKIAQVRGFSVSSYDLDPAMIKWAQILHKDNKLLSFEQKDVMKITGKFDVVSASSLLSVVDDKKAVISKLVSLLKGKNSKLILIDATEEMSVKNIYKNITGLKTLYYFKLLLVWAQAREGKAFNINIFNDIKNISHHYVLDGMVRVTVIGKEDSLKRL